MTLEFKKAVKSRARLRLALVGPSGSGKTYSAMAIARGLNPNGRIAVIDTERGSASKYADLFNFDVLEMASFSPANYVDAMKAAENAGYDIIIIDSLTHAWSGKGGALEMVDAAVARSKSANSFGAWREVTPAHNAMVEAIVSSPCHVIATMRSKTEYIVEPDPRTGRNVPRKIGMAPIQRDGLEYEFDVVGDIDLEHRLIVTKSRIPLLADSVVTKPNQAFGAIMAAWLEGKPSAQPEPMIGLPKLIEAAPAVEPAPVEATRKPTLATGKQLAEIRSLGSAAGVGAEFYESVKTRFNVKQSQELTKQQAALLIDELATMANMAAK
jgi:ABC-type oligopeptide transport system ATPase subunit